MTGDVANHPHVSFVYTHTRQTILGSFMRLWILSLTYKAKPDSDGRWDDTFNDGPVGVWVNRWVISLFFSVGTESAYVAAFSWQWRWSLWSSFMLFRRDFIDWQITVLILTSCCHFYCTQVTFPPSSLLCITLLPSMIKFFQEWIFWAHYYSRLVFSRMLKWYN